MRATARRPSALVIVVLFTSASWALLAPEAAQASHPYYLNVNQQVVRPGENLGVTLSSLRVDGTLYLVLLDPAAFSRQQTLEATSRVVDSRSVSAQSGSSQTFTFSALEAGLYAVVMRTEGTDDWWSVVQVTRAAAVAKVASQETMYWVVGLDGGSPVEGAEILINGSVAYTTGADGVAQVPDAPDSVVVQTSMGPVFVSSRSYYGGSLPQRVAVYTDRPLYRPDQTVHLKLVAWEPQGGGYGPPQQANQTVGVQVMRWGPTGQTTMARTTLTLNEYGTALWDLRVPDDAPLGDYQVRVQWDSQMYAGSFEVQEYRLPNFRVSVSPSQADVAIGGVTELLVASSYYYGEPLTEGDVSYTVSGAPAGYYGCPWCGYEYYGQRDNYREEGSMALGADGTARIRVSPEFAGEFTVQVYVTAPTGERIADSARVVVHSADRVVGLDFERWYLEAGRSSPVAVVLTDLDGNPVTAPVEIVNERRLYGRADGESRSIVDRSTVQVTDGVGSYDLRVASSGSYVLTAIAQDAAGRQATTTRWFWASDDSGIGEVGSDLEIIPQRVSVGPGDVVRAQVAAGSSAPVLVTWESGRVLDYVVVWPGVGGQVEFDAVAEAAPAAHIVGLQLLPQAGFVPSARQADARIEVLPRTQELVVSVLPDRSHYEDGESARLLVQVRDWQGRAVQAEVSVSMVDEALLDLSDRSAADLVRTFYPEKGRSWPTFSWYGESLRSTGQEEFDADSPVRAEPPAAPATGADGSNGGASAPPESINVREYFPETALWAGALSTDDNGDLRIDASLPDSLTTWKIVAVAVTREGQVGVGDSNLVTRRNLVSDLFTPRFFVEGDVGTVQATVANYVGQTRDIEVLLELDGAQLIGPVSRTLTLAHGQSGLVSYRVAAPSVGTASLTLFAWTGVAPAAGDAIRIPVPVQAFGVRRSIAESGVDDAERTIVIPAETSNGGVLNVTLSPTVAGALVDALPYLTGYPYGCVEQTLSRFLPTLAVADAALAFGLNRTDIDPLIDDQVDVGLRRLYDFQHSTGAWGWWTSDPDNPYTTAYVVYGLAVARDAGYTVNEQVLSRGVSALQAMVAQSEPSALRAYQRYALSVADAGSVDAVPAGDSDAELAFGALVAARVGQMDLAKAKVDQLSMNAVRDGSGRVHWQEGGGGWTSHGISSSTMLTALVLRAFSAVDPGHADAHAAAGWLLNERRGAHWYTTKDTAETVISLGRFVVDSGQLNADFTAVVMVDNERFERSFSSGNLFLPAEPIVLSLDEGEHSVSVVREGPGTLYWGLRAEYYGRGAADLVADEDAFVVRHEMLVDGRPVSLLSVGDEATVRVTVEAVGQDRRYVMLESPLPAGLEVVEQDDRYGGHGRWYYGGGGGGGVAFSSIYWASTEVRDDRVSLSLPFLRAGEVRGFQYQVRAVFAGEYAVLPARAEAMYDPDASGHGAPGRLVVTPVPALQIGRLAAGPQGLAANVYPVGQVGGILTAELHSVDGLVRAATFGLDGQGRFRVLLPFVAEDGSVLTLRAGSVVLSRPLAAAQSKVAAEPRFDPVTEEIWGAGPVIRIVSALAPAAPPDYSVVFIGQQSDDLPDRGSPPLPARSTPGLSWSSVLGALVVALWAARHAGGPRRGSASQ